MQKETIAELILTQRQAKATSKRINTQLDQELKLYVERTRTAKDAETQLSFLGLNDPQGDLDQDTNGLDQFGKKSKKK